ncbi:class III aminotransferase [Nemania sp. FL0916]|nr:class III aminotransferase [Nemania sp. FL0916]
MVSTSNPPDRLQTAYEAAEARYKAANPGSGAAHETATAHLPGGNTRSVLHWAPYPLSIAAAAGFTLRDADGHAYTDLLGEYSAGLYGHSHPVLLAALADTASRGLSYGGPHAAEARLAGLVCARFFRGGGTGMETVRFTNSGTEANLMAIAAAKTYTGRYRGKVMVFDGAYHGGVLAFPFGCAGVWNNDNNRGGEGEKDGERAENRKSEKYRLLRALNAPHDFLVATYNDIASVDALIDSVASTTEREDDDEHEHGLAAILIEPMLGSGGGICATPAFLAHLRRRANEAGALLIFDEVMTSRMHSGGGLQSTLDVRPHMTTLGKYLGGGMSFGAFGGEPDIMALFDPRSNKLPHAGTFNNNVLTMNVGAAGLAEVFTPAVAEELHALGEELREKLNALGDATTAIGTESEGNRGWKLRALGRGSIIVIHFTRAEVEDIASPRDFSDEDMRVLDLFHLEMLNEGFYLARRGYIALSIAFLEDGGRGQLDEFVGAVERFVKRLRDLFEG